MSRQAIHLSLLAVAILSVVSLHGDAGAAPRQIVIESRFLEVAQYDLTGSGADYPYFQYDTSNGLKFKTGKSFRKDGVKYRGIRMKARQDAASGFVSLGQEFSTIGELIVTGTLQLQSMKGLRTGSTIGIEFDSPFVPVGGSVGSFLFVGASYDSGGLLGFTSHNGTNIGSFPFFANAMSLDIQTRFAPSGVTVDMKPSDQSGWTNLVTDFDFVTVEGIGVGIGMSGVDKGAKAIAGCIRVEGPQIYRRPALVPLLEKVDAIRESLVEAHTAMTREDGNGDPDPDIPGAEAGLTTANDLRIQLATEFDVAWSGGQLDPNTPYEDVMKRLDKAEKKLVPVLGRIPTLGNLFRNSDERRVRKAELMIFLTAKLLTVGDE